MAREQAHAYQRRWARVAEQEKAELRAMSPDDKFRQVCALHASIKPMGWDEALSAEADVERVREVWKRLRKAYHERT